MLQHKVVIGKTRDGMSGFLAQAVHPTVTGKPQTSVLLDTLMRRI